MPFKPLGAPAPNPPQELQKIPPGAKAKPSCFLAGFRFQPKNQDIPLKILPKKYRLSDKDGLLFLLNMLEVSSGSVSLPGLILHPYDFRVATHGHIIEALGHHTSPTVFTCLPQFNCDHWTIIRTQPPKHHEKKK